MSKIKDSREATFIGRRTDGSTLRRPLSPHLQVYDMVQITSGLSIANRITGCAWTVGLIFMVWWLVAAAAGPQAFANVQWFLSSFLGILILLGMTAAAWFHTLGGIRHLVWDAGFAYDLPSTHRSGQAVMIGTGVMTVLTWLVAIIAWA
ncbi:succinate dehydrogenase, cytochrome b556 subunit [Pseudoroseomonas globiformis]|uniref:Succinate dehydrogenase cytochrome b556 subunit n=1 Tax=Teichococcus globiformis TaxID=2307229 RepID=A0ABV7G049_9PROT